MIGSYLFAMGIGSYLSRFIRRGLVARFIAIELMVGLVGGFSSSALFLAFAYTDAFRLLLYVIVLVVGTLVGLEIPLLMRILKERFEFRELVAHVLTFDYLGALGASLLFPILLVPRLGLVRSAILFGIVNAGVALWTTFIFREQLGVARALRAGCLAVLALLGGGMIFADRISAAADDNLYADEVIFARSTRYQRIVLTKWKDDLRLFLSSHLQFSSRDEYRYHEALVHPGLAALPGARRVLVLGGGDGLALREILKYPSVESVTLVDLDPEMTSLFTTHPVLSQLNARLILEPQGARGQSGCVPLAGSQSRFLRFHRDRLSRSHQLLARQAVHHGLLSPDGQAPEPRWPGCRAEHVAAVCASFVLVHRRDTQARRPEDLPVPRLRAELRRVGLRARLLGHLRPADRVAAWPPIPEHAERRRAVPVPERHASGAV